MPVFDRFDATRTRALPAGWVLPAGADSLVQRLEAHGIAVETLEGPWTGPLEVFTVDSIIRSPRLFQKHREVSVEGRWAAAPAALPRGTRVVSAAQPLAALAAILLEPESDDGYTTWNVFDAALVTGQPHPVRRALSAWPRPARGSRPPSSAPSPRPSRPSRPS
jgi:hypothetical protein